MNRWMKLGLVLAGYALAFVASVLSVAIYDRRFSPADNQAMGGMIADGEMLFGGAVFGLVSIVPTGLALWFLRGSRRFWTAFSAAGFAFAIAGLAAVLTALVARGSVAQCARDRPREPAGHRTDAGLPPVDRELPSVRSPRAGTQSTTAHAGRGGD